MKCRNNFKIKTFLGDMIMFFKNNFFRFFIVFALLNTAQLFAVSMPTLSAWYAAICTLPKNRSDKNHNNIAVDPNVHSGFAVFSKSKKEQWEMLNDVVEIFQKIQKKQKNNDLFWLASNEGKLVPNCFKNTNSTLEFTPFAQKIVATPDQEFIMRGDLHGDVISFATQLMDMKKAGKIDDNFKLAHHVRFVALGDYTDRGKFGAEVWYMLLRLANANPEQVVLVRGNHEDYQVTNVYGFKSELKAKFGDDEQADFRYEKINNIHNLLPVVLYLGNQQGKFIQCCHGGLEMGYSPKALLDAPAIKKYQELGLLYRKASFVDIVSNSNSSDALKTSMNVFKHLMQDNVRLTNPCGDYYTEALGFMWSDFIPDINDALIMRYKKGRGFEYGKEAVDAIISQQNSNRNKIVAIVRGHQHSENPEDTMMKKIIQGNGIARLWSKGDDFGLDHNVVCTLNVAPDSGYGKNIGFDEDTSIGVTCLKDGSWIYKMYKHKPFNSLCNTLFIKPKQNDNYYNRFMSFIHKFY